ncbi:MAG: hypothetical protein HC918_14395, partial [Oscillatoriales cyanobacterium SM2_1_8]|nr:hypothetical protein [Oscillatoriales cyanobacterium SM2_1_8]
MTMLVVLTAIGAVGGQPGDGNLPLPLPRRSPTPVAYEARLSPAQEPGEEEETPPFVPAQFAPPSLPSLGQTS